uniref:Uncharacterized protein n=1 Tax=Arundo donax TaxID=35708 RepID=A0A0A9A6M1_ARUDO
MRHNILTIKVSSFPVCKSNWLTDYIINGRILFESSHSQKEKNNAH